MPLKNCMPIEIQIIRHGVTLAEREMLQDRVECWTVTEEKIEHDYVSWGQNKNKVVLTRQFKVLTRHLVFSPIPSLDCCDVRIEHYTNLRSFFRPSPPLIENPVIFVD